MNYTVKGKEKGTIFCIHGNSSSAKIFEDLLNSDKISQTKIAFDLFGHGENQSKKLTLNNFSFECHKKFILDKISKIDGDILLIGNSLGGHLAIEIANEIPNLKGIVIMGAPPVKEPINFEEAFLPEKALNTFFTEHPTDQEIINTIDIVLFDKSKSSILISDFKKSNPLVRKAIANDIHENKFTNQFSIFTNLTIPKYIVTGDSDTLLNREYLETVKENSKTPCILIDFKKCGHYPSLEKPLDFNNLIKEISTEVFN
jgi:pimeloyl-ACP methyl ester carboxylesterase